MIMFEKRENMNVRIRNSFDKRIKIMFAVFIFLFVFISFFLTGCGKKKAYNGYYIYGLDATEKKIMYEKCSIPKKGKKDALVKKFLSKMQKEPDDINMKKAIPDDVKVDNFDINSSGELSLYFNAAYGNYTGVAEILRRAAIVKTLSQIKEIRGIQFYVSGQPITDSNMNPIGIMTADSFIDNTGGVSDYKQKTTLNVYFSDNTGKSLVVIPVDITYNATIPLEQLAIEQLISGPYTIEGVSKNNVLPTVPRGTVLNKVTVKENTCYVDFSKEFLNKEDNITDYVAIYSVVNTLVELPSVNKVQFSIDGEQVLKYNQNINFGEAFERNLDLVKESK